MSQLNISLVRGVYEAFAAGDIARVLAAFDPKIEWREADNFLYADGNPYVGPDAIVNGVFLRLVEEWDGFAASPHRYLDAGDTIVALGHYTGECKSTGMRIEAQFAHVWTVSAGKITEFQQYTDTLQFANSARQFSAV